MTWFKRSRLVLTINAFLLGFGSVSSQSEVRHETLRIVFPRPWGSLTPYLQHTAGADVILGCQFEPLVDLDKSGAITPRAAQSWVISTDMRTFTFKIDISKRFSDGSPLKASDFKAAWEFGLRQAPRASNNGLADVLNRVEGYDQFEASGTLTGIIASTDDTLEIHFAKPFRMALDHLTGNRFAAWRKNGLVLIGTGPYIIANPDEKILQLTSNPFFNGLRGYSSVTISVPEGKDPIDILKSGEADVLSFAGRSYVNFTKAELEANLIGSVVGMEGAHMMVALNGASTSLFSNLSIRQSFQTMLFRGSKADGPFVERLKDLSANLKIDPQPFLPIQPGRIEAEEVDSIFEQAASNLEDDLRKLKSGRPIKVIYVKGAVVGQMLLEYFKEVGIPLTSDSGALTLPEVVTGTLKKGDADIVVITGSVVGSDPDGIYHLLGRDGAITSPFYYREEVGNLLEEGRGILSRDAMVAHYSKVTRAFLKSVPFVHIGYTIGSTLYRTDRVTIDPSTTKSRVREPIEQFRQKN